MTSLDLRVGALSLLGNPGTSRTLRLVFTAAGDPVTPGPVSVWLGGDERHPTDFTGAVEHPAAVAGNEATVTVPIPAGRELLRVTIDGALATIGTVTPSLRGTPDQNQTVQVHLGALEVHLDLAAVPIDLEQRLAGKQDADQALTDLSGATVEAWGKSWLAISEAAAARAALGLGTAATMSPAEIAADPALSATFAPLAAGIEGAGMPEGVVTAPVGTVYRDLVATNGAVLWVKVSGTGATGWRVMWGDTGWRAIATWDTAGVITGTPHWVNMEPVSGEAGGIFLRRINERVLMALHSVRFTSTSSHFQGGPIQQSGGFRFPGPDAWPGARRTIPMRDLSMRAMSRPGYVYLVGTSGQQTYAEGSTVEWVTTDPWPTTLPGTPA